MPFLSIRNLMKPHNKKNLTDEKFLFNYHLSRNKRVVTKECV